MENWHILVIEDDPDGQEVIARLLRFHNIPNQVVGTAEAALELMREQTFTGCIIDLHLPGMDGWRLLNRIQANDATANTPCVAITAYHSSNLPTKAREAGFEAYLPKPFEPGKLVKVMGEVFGH